MVWLSAPATFSSVLLALRPQSSGLDPAVVAAIIAAAISLMTLVGSLLVQVYGIRRASRDADTNVRSLVEQQREQLDRTIAEERSRTLNERFATAADRLGADKPAAVRLAAVYAMAGLADDWPGNRQTCVDVLCAYLRMPYEPDPGEDAPADKRLQFRADQQVRHTVIRVITANLRDGRQPSWQGLNFDFTSAVFDGGDFSGARFSGGTVSFTGARFSGGTVDFSFARCSSGTVSFSDARLSGGTVLLPDDWLPLTPEPE